MELTLTFTGDEASDFLKFVLKDEATGRWYDLNGTNFHIPLRRALVSSTGSLDDEDVFSVPEADLPTLPDELCGTWAYIKWEVAGCPNRSQRDSDLEFQKAIQVLGRKLHMNAVAGPRLGLWSWEI